MSKLINVIKDKYSVIPNEVFTDRRLDYRCKGVLCTLLSLPNGWDFSIPGLVELVTPRNDEGNVIELNKGEGKDAVRVALQKLERLGYLERILAHVEGGKFGGYVNYTGAMLANENKYFFIVSDYVGNERNFTITLDASVAYSVKGTFAMDGSAFVSRYGLTVAVTEEFLTRF